ncbi:MAG TPA: class I SAM-dependent methyltransferase [Acidimicrobiales bacterium]|jgi:SAM-dependent methyltransferase|nr:class I SAM-dependent methyltransferase [Acidimicrobiales bacterium]
MVGSHPIHAALYDPFMGLADRAGLAERRRRLIAEATGRVLEVGGGTGLNLRHYRDVESVCVTEPDAAMRKRLLGRVGSAAVPVEVHELPIEATGLPDQAFDTVVCTLVLCTVADPEVALREIRRLLAPGGRLLFLEHVRSPGWRGRVQAVTTPVWSATAGAGCHLDRRTLDSIRSAGFVIDRCERSGMLAAGVAVPSKRSDRSEREVPA